jgi:MFS transporter, AAHS family, vanillate permease
VAKLTKYCLLNECSNVKILGQNFNKPFSIRSLMMSAPSTPVSSQALVAEVIDHGPITAQQLIVVALCLILNMLDGFDITAMAVAVNSIGNELALAEDKLGLVFSFALAGMMIGAMFLAAVSDVIGRRKVILICVVGIGVTVILTGFVESLWSLILLRFISGLGAGAMLAGQATLAYEYSPAKFRSLAVATVTAGYPLGAMMTGLVASEMVPVYGWRSIFFLGGGATLIVGAVAYFLMPESLQFLFEKRPKGALQKSNKILKKLKRAPLADLPVVETQGGVNAGKSSVISNMLALMTPAHRRSTLSLWLTFFLCFCALYFLMSWIPKMVINSGLSEQTGNYAFSLFNLGGVIGIFILGAMGTRWKLTNLVSFFLLAAAIAMIVFASLPTQENMLLILILIIGILQQGGFTGLYIVATKIYPTEIRSTGVGWAIGLGRFGAVIGPAVAGVTIASGFSMASNFYIFAIPMMIGGVLAYCLHVD